MLRGVLEAVIAAEFALLKNSDHDYRKIHL